MSHLLSSRVEDRLRHNLLKLQMSVIRAYYDAMTLSDFFELLCGAGGTLLVAAGIVYVAALLFGLSGKKKGEVLAGTAKDTEPYRAARRGCQPTTGALRDRQ